MPEPRPHAYGVFLLDREPSDTQVGLPPGEPAATDKTVELVDRDGGRYVGTLVLAADTWTEACSYVRRAYESGEASGRGVDGYEAHAVPRLGLKILELAVRPRAGSPPKFAC